MATLVHATEPVEFQTTGASERRGEILPESMLSKNEEASASCFPEIAPASLEELVDFDGPDDKLNPINWSPSYKWTIVASMSVMTLLG